MNILVPQYYKNFKCIADKCKHNCCIGWEIEIDADSLDFYNSLDSQFGEEIRNNIKNGCFVLRDNERCPFLDHNGLCRIISNLGENALCEICTFHPRFRNFYSDFCEMGTGLCCEESARIILNCEEPFKLELIEGDGTIEIPEEEEYVLNIRQKLFNYLNGDNSFKDKFLHLLKEVGYENISLDNVCDMFLSLERLDENWTDVLNNLKGYNFDYSVFDKFSIPFYQLLCYFIYRHLCDAIWENNLIERLRFCLLAVYLCGAIYQQTNSNLQEIVRMFSAEVEYSEINMERIIKKASLSAVGLRDKLPKNHDFGT